MSDFILQPNEFGLCVEAKYAPGAVSKTWAIPDGTRVQIWADGEIEEIDGGEVVVATLAERVNRFFRDKPGSIYLFRTTPLALEYLIPGVRSKEMLAFSVMLVLKVQIIDLGPFRLGLMDRTGPVSLARVQEFFAGEVEQAIHGFLKDVAIIDDFENKPVIERMAEVRRQLSAPLNAVFARYGLVVEVTGFGLQNLGLEAAKDEKGRLWLERHKNAIFLANDKENEKLHIERALLDDAKRQRDLSAKMRDLFANDFLEKIKQTQAQQGETAKKQHDLNLSKMEQDARRAKELADAEAEQAMRKSQATLDEIIQKQDWNQKKLEQDGLFEIEERRAKLTWEELERANQFGVAGLMHITDSDLKSLMLMTQWFAQTMAGESVSAEKATMLSQMYDRLVQAFQQKKADSAASAESGAAPAPESAQESTDASAQREAPFPADDLFNTFVTQYHNRHHTDSSGLSTSLIDGYGRPLRSATVDDDFQLRIRSDQPGYCVVISSSRPEKAGGPPDFSLLTPNEVSRIPFLAAGTYLLPGRELLPLPNQVLGLENERLLFNDPGYEDVLVIWITVPQNSVLFQPGTRYDVLPDLGLPQACVTALRPAPFDSRWNGGEALALLKGLLPCKNLMIATLSIPVTA